MKNDDDEGVSDEGYGDDSYESDTHETCDYVGRFN